MAGLWIVNFIGLIVAEGITHYRYRPIKYRSRARCFTAFLHNNGFGAAVFAGVAGDYLVR